MHKRCDRLNLAFTYIYRCNQSDTDASSNLANLQTFTAEAFGEAVPTVSDSYGVEFSWELSDRLAIGSWGGFSKVTTLSTLEEQIERGTQDIWNWVVTLAFPDLGQEGNLGGIVVGMEPWVSIEAEDLKLETYLVEDFSAIETDDNTTTANAQGISLLGASDLTGTASLSASQFNLSGTYDLEISYFDENDGDAQLQVELNGTPVGNLLLNENTSSDAPTEDTRREYVIEDLLILPTDSITIRGAADDGEWARVDFITFFEDNSGAALSPTPTNGFGFIGDAGNAGAPGIIGVPDPTFSFSI